MPNPYTRVHDLPDHTPSAYCKPCREEALLSPLKTCTRCKEAKDRSAFYPNKDGLGGYHSNCKACCRARTNTYLSDPINKRVEKERKWSQRLETLAAYGGACKCCGEATPEFLAVDHVNNNGAEHRREIGSKNLAGWLRKNGFPQEGFQLLCHNCNMAKEFYGEGSCIHVNFNLIDLLTNGGDLDAFAARSCA